MITLEFPNKTHKWAFEQMRKKRKQYEVSKESESLFRHKTYETFLSEREADIFGRPGLVPAIFFFSFLEGEIVGHIQIRRHIEHPNLKEFGGHIGYAVVPWEQGKGYGKEQLRLALLRAKEYGLSQVMISCLSENIASARVIESQGGILYKEDILENPPSDRKEFAGKLKRRYLINLSEVGVKV